MRMIDEYGRCFELPSHPCEHLSAQPLSFLLSSHPGAVLRDVTDLDTLPCCIEASMQRSSVASIN